MAFQPKSTEEKILHRLQIARGHLEKVLKMHENHESCIDMLHQSKAVQAALKKADHVILQNHLETCVRDDIVRGQAKRAIDEIMEVIKKEDE